MASAAELIPHSFVTQGTPTAAKCAEKACPFPPVPGETLCRRHLEMFAAVEESDEENPEDSLEESSLRANVEGSQRRNGKSIQHQAARSEIFAGRVEVENPIDRWRRKKEEQKEKREYRNILSGLATARMHRRRRQQGLCQNCASPIGNAACIRCHRRRLGKINQRKEKALCTLCGKEPATSGKLKCSGCLEKMKVYKKRSYRNAIARNAQHVRASGVARKIRSRAARLTVGKCERCGGLRDNSTACCNVCRVVQNTARRKRHRKLLRLGICVVCGKKRARKNLTSCSKCGKRMSASKKRGRFKKNSVVRTATVGGNKHEGNKTEGVSRAGFLPESPATALLRSTSAIAKGGLESSA
jgi:hypothetical protein